MHLALAHAGARVDAVFYCPHGQDAGCECRKPKPGLLLDIAHRFNIDLTDVPCVGDSLRDLQAADAVGALPLLVLTGKGKQTQIAGGLPKRTQIHADLAAAVKSIVS
jgi:D-glycero-D-manno-heptose 1,7-bisphosphate phosphatase